MLAFLLCCLTLSWTVFWDISRLGLRFYVLYCTIRKKRIFDLPLKCFSQRTVKDTGPSPLFFMISPPPPVKRNRCLKFLLKLNLPVLLIPSCISHCICWFLLHTSASIQDTIMMLGQPKELEIHTIETSSFRRNFRQRFLFSGTVYWGVGEGKGVHLLINV